MSAIIWKSEVTYKGETFIVSTISRRYVTAEGESTGLETLVLRTLEPDHIMGENIHQAGGLNDHQAICRSLLSTGTLPKEDIMDWNKQWYKSLQD